MADYSHLPYRPCVGIMLLNSESKVFVAQRIDTTAEAWQMPQGGVDTGEDIYEAALRELREETSVPPDAVSLIEKYQDSLTYDLPTDLVPKLWGGKYRGQEQHWFALRLEVEDNVVNIETDEPEFHRWRWADIVELPELIVPFKRDMYEILAKWGEDL